LPGDDDADLETNQLGSRLREERNLSSRRSELQSNILAFDIANFLQPFPERLQKRSGIRIAKNKHADRRYLGLLRAPPAATPPLHRPAT
jgi:hypothetical protein